MQLLGYQSEKQMNVRWVAVACVAGFLIRGGIAPAATGHEVGALQPFDELMARFMQTHNVPGAALAVTRHGRLVYARGFGWADVEEQLPVQPDSSFRIASLSKPITAVAILQLVERGEIGLDDHVFDRLEHRPYLEPGAQPDPRLSTITVLHLLCHTAGWNRRQSFDPMGISGTLKIAKALGIKPPGHPDDIIRYMMGRPLEFSPGERVAYSNFGYLLLGRLIEQATGQPYEAYVAENVLRPLGITEMRIGGTAIEQRAAGEVVYYDERDRTTIAAFGPQSGNAVPLPYARCVEIMDAHGGWIASAVDLVRFSAAFDRPKACPLLGSASIERMFARPEGRAGFGENGKPLPAYYACGWNVRPKGGTKRNTWHTGGIAGTSTLLVRRQDGLNWVVLFNTHADSRGKALAGLIDPLLHIAADAVETWPEHDLFLSALSDSREP